MKAHWLNKKGNKKCILFFNGWGMDENAVKHLAADDYDVYMCSNYSSIEGIEIYQEHYDKVYLVAWSLGVWAVSVAVDPEKVHIDKAIAINGTQMPKNEESGIHPAIFENTLENWDTRNRNKFNMRILGGKEAFAKWNNLLSSRPCEEQKKELENINNQLNATSLSNIKYDCSLIGKKDLIFLPENQVRYWKDKADIVEMDLPHYPFAHFTSWNQIICL